MAYLEALKSGFLFLKHKGKGADKSGLKKWKKRWVYLQKDATSGQSRLDHYDSEDRAMKGKGGQTFSLKGAVAIDDVFSKSQKYAFEITFPNYSLACGVSSGTELRDWQARLTILLFSDSGLSPRGEVKSVPEPSEPFVIKISQTDSSVAAGLHGDYRLDVTSDDRLVLTPLVSGQMPAEWKLSHIRNFVLLPIKGEHDILVMESGRRSSTGVGTFQFITSQGDYLYDYIHTRTFRLSRSSSGSTCPVPVEPVRPTITPPMIPPRRSPMFLARRVSDQPPPLGDEDQDDVLTSSQVQPFPDEAHVQSLASRQQESVPTASDQPGSDSSDLLYDEPAELVPRIPFEPVATNPFATNNVDKYTTMKADADANLEDYTDSDTDEDCKEEKDETRDGVQYDNEAINRFSEEGSHGEDDTYEPICTGKKQK